MMVRQSVLETQKGKEYLELPRGSHREGDVLLNLEK